jgi:hypothetical protein
MNIALRHIYSAVICGSLQQKTLAYLTYFGSLGIETTNTQGAKASVALAAVTNYANVNEVLKRDFLFDFDILMLTTDADRVLGTFINLTFCQYVILPTHKNDQ